MTRGNFYLLEAVFKKVSKGIMVNRPGAGRFSIERLVVSNFLLFGCGLVLYCFAALCHFVRLDAKNN